MGNHGPTLGLGVLDGEVANGGGVSRQEAAVDT